MDTTRLALRPALGCFLAALIFAFTPGPAGAAESAGPPCNPCGGVRVEDPASVLPALAAEPRLAGEERLYVVWPVELDGSADLTPLAAVEATGATPWLVVRFHTPAPVVEHLAMLEVELVELARLARGAGSRPHLQIDWQPVAGNGEAREATPADLAFLLKRAAVAVTGANPDARVIVGPLRPDPAALRALYGEEVAAYVDGVALAPAPAEELIAARETLASLDPGKPAVLDALPWPAAAAGVLPRSAEAAARGFAVTLFAIDPAAPPGAGDLVPLKLLAREFVGELSYDPYTVPEGGKGAWTFVRGEDLGLRVVAEPEPGAESLELLLPDPQLRSPDRIDLGDGSDLPVFGQVRTDAGLFLPLDNPGAAVLLRVARMSAAELEGIAEEIDIADERQMPVEEILRRLQAFEDDQVRRVDHYQAENTLHLRFLFGAGAATIEASYAGSLFFQQGQPFDWVWETFYVDGVRWRGDKIPEIPLVQPEKAAVRPAEITLSKEYRYRLRGTDTVEGRDTWVVDFEPIEVIPGRSLYQGTVWVDRQLYCRVKSRTLQLGLEGEVISNEETRFYTPIDENGAPSSWGRESFFLATRVVGQQVLSILNAPIPVEVETRMANIRINKPDFDTNRQQAYASERTMVRDTDAGLRYLERDEEGNRTVKEGFDTNRLFLAGGVFYDESVDFPIPLVGINYFDLDFRGSGNQLNIFFAGALLTANIAEPRLAGSQWDAGANLFGFFIDRSDQLFEAGREVPEEEIQSKTGQVALFLGRPLGNFVKLDFTYRLSFDKYGRADKTAEDFTLPGDTLTHGFQTDLSFNRSGYRLSLMASYNRRGSWEFWGRPGNPEFDPAQEDYVRWQVTAAKTWWFSRFKKFGIELEHLNGSDLDRFSRYDFGIFGDSSVAGYPGGLVRGDEASGVHVNWGINAGELFRAEVGTDAVWVSNQATGLEDELLAGIGLQGTVTLPWQLLVNFEVGYAFEGPGDGDVSARIVFLRLFGGK